MRPETFLSLSPEGALSLPYHPSRRDARAAAKRAAPWVPPNPPGLAKGARSAPLRRTHRPRCRCPRPQAVPSPRLSRSRAARPYLLVGELRSGCRAGSASRSGSVQGTAASSAARSPLGGGVRRAAQLRRRWLLPGPALPGPTAPPAARNRRGCLRCCPPAVPVLLLRPVPAVSTEGGRGQSGTAGLAGILRAVGDSLGSGKSSPEELLCSQTRVAAGVVADVEKCRCGASAAPESSVAERAGGAAGSCRHHGGEGWKPRRGGSGPGRGSGSAGAAMGEAARAAAWGTPRFCRLPQRSGCGLGKRIAPHTAVAIALSPNPRAKAPSRCLH